MLNPPPERVIRRLEESMFIVDGSDCIETTYSTGSHGYGQIGWHVASRGRSVMQLTHRVAWFAKFGDIPQDMTADHVCRNRQCVNVDHLRLLPNHTNASDNGFATRTHCPRGHEYDEANTHVSRTGGRKCRACQQMRNDARYAA